MRRLFAVVVALGAVLTIGALPGARAKTMVPGSAEYIQRDNQNMLDAYGRQTGPGGQLSPEYLLEVFPAGTTWQQQVLNQAQNPTRPILDPGQLVPGWNEGNAFRLSWPRTRGVMIPVAFTNRYGAMLRGTVFAPRGGARDPYTGQTLQGPFPAVAITTG